MLVDTGADLSAVPLPLGQLLVADITLGQPIHLGGIISSSAQLNAFVHRIQARLGSSTFEMPLAIATSPAIPPIFGRLEALDRFEVRFVSGKELVIET